MLKTWLIHYAQVERLCIYLKRRDIGLARNCTGNQDQSKFLISIQTLYVHSQYSFLFIPVSSEKNTDHMFHLDKVLPYSMRANRTHELASWAMQRLRYCIVRLFAKIYAWIIYVSPLAHKVRELNLANEITQLSSCKPLNFTSILTNLQTGISADL